MIDPITNYVKLDDEGKFHLLMNKINELVVAHNLLVEEVFKEGTPQAGEERKASEAQPPKEGKEWKYGDPGKAK